MLMIFNSLTYTSAGNTSQLVIWVLCISSSLKYNEHWRQYPSCMASPPEYFKRNWASMCWVWLLDEFVSAVVKLKAANEFWAVDVDVVERKLLYAISFRRVDEECWLGEPTRDGKLAWLDVDKFEEYCRVWEWSYGWILVECTAETGCWLTVGHIKSASAKISNTKSLLHFGAIGNLDFR